MFLAGLAEGLEPAMQALATSIAGLEFNASLFTFVSMLDTCAELLGGPITAATFSIRDAENLPAGYCFFSSAVSVLWPPRCCNRTD